MEIFWVVVGVILAVVILAIGGREYFTHIRRSIYLNQSAVRGDPLHQLVTNQDNYPESE